MFVGKVRTVTVLAGTLVLLFLKAIYVLYKRGNECLTSLNQ